MGYRIRDSKPIAEICRARRLELGLTQSYLSWATGISPQLFSQFEAGINNSMSLFLIYEPFLTADDWTEIRKVVHSQNADAKRNLELEPEANKSVDR